MFLILEAGRTSFFPRTQLLSEVQKFKLYKTPCRKSLYTSYCFLNLDTEQQSTEESWWSYSSKPTTDVTGWIAYSRMKQNSQKDTLWFFSFLHQFLLLKSVRNGSCAKVDSFSEGLTQAGVEDKMQKFILITHVIKEIGKYIKEREFS